MHTRSTKTGIVAPRPFVAIAEEQPGGFSSMRSLLAFLKNKGPGLAVVAVFAVAAIVLGKLSSLVGAATIALLLGLVLGNLWKSRQRIEPGMGYAEKRVLEASVVLMGFGINTHIFAELGWHTWAFVFGSVILVMLVAALAGRWLGLSPSLSALLGAGSGICGSAAIGAISPLINSREEETGMSVGTINLLGTAGLVLLPAISTLFSFDHEAAGLFIGGVIQSMGHVVGAGFSLGPEVGAMATVIKMGRVTLIIPLILLMFILGRKTRVKGQAVKFPLFIPLFILSMVLTQLPVFPQKLASGLAGVGDILLIGAMVGIGFKIKLRPLFRIAGPALLAGTVIFAFQIALYLGYLLLF